jgi:hypothetical protein
MVVPANLPGTTNTAPLADILGDQQGKLTFPDTGKSGQETVVLDGTGSTDADGTIVAYRWSWVDAKGAPQSATGPRLTVNIVTSFNYAFTLVVEDDMGADSAPDTVQVTVTPKSGGKGKPPR